jgi:hypothetical protein
MTLCTRTFSTTINKSWPSAYWHSIQTVVILIIIYAAFMLSVNNKPLMLSVPNKPFALSVAMLNVTILSVAMLNVIILSVAMLSVVAP